MNEKAKEIISIMTLEEKAAFVSGEDFWHTKSISRLGIHSITLSDGPAGLRKQVIVDGVTTTVPSTCFPSESLLACSWDTELMEQVGCAMAEEARFEDVNVILGPGNNIKRSPLCGRNFEYLSEDPYLSGVMAGHIIKGIQSKGVGTSLKHYIANNQEHRRLCINAVIDERALREIYLKSFEYAIKIGRPWTVMCSYNRVNGKYVCESQQLLTDVLRNEWGFDGVVVSDWGAVNERVKCLRAGLDLEMPSSGVVNTQKIIDAVNNSELDIEVLDRSVERILNLVLRAVDSKEIKIPENIKEINHKKAREIAKECIVLLKNEEEILPISKDENIAFIGMFAKDSRFQGGGSSHVIPVNLESAYDEMCKLLGRNIPFAAGYNMSSDTPDEVLINEAREIAAKVQKVVIFAGLPEVYEAEGYDRNHMELPASHIKLINEMYKVNQNVVVVVSNGAPVDMSWINNTKAVMECYLWGQSGAGAVCELLLGLANPCGKLAETFPKVLEHNPSYLNFPGEDDDVYYRESIFTGYRYYDTKRINPQFCFGHGISYTSFEYSSLEMDATVFSTNDQIAFKFRVKNTGDRQGKEIYQIYIKDIESSFLRPEKELKYFGKVELKPGEEKVISIKLETSDFAHYCINKQAFRVESGDFMILVGASSEDIRLTASIRINSDNTVRKIYHKNSTIGDIKENPFGKKLLSELEEKHQEAFTMIFNNDMEEDGTDFKDKMTHYTVLRSLVWFSRGAISEQQIEELIDKLNNQ